MPPHSPRQQPSGEGQNRALVRPERLPGLQKLLRHPNIAVKALADLAGYSERRAYKTIDGERPLSVRELRAWMPEIRRATDGTDILEEILGLRDVGLEVRPVAAAEPTTADLARAVIGVSAEVGELGSDVLRATEDGRIDLSEEQEIRGDIRAARRKLNAAEALLDAAPQPQLSLSVATH